MVTPESYESSQPSIPIALGQDVYAADGVRIGSIAEIQPNVFIVARGPLSPPERVVPRAAVGGVDQAGVHLRMSLAQVQAETPPARLPLQARQAPPVVDPAATVGRAPRPGQAATPAPPTRPGTSYTAAAAPVPPGPPVDDAPFRNPAMEQTLQLSEERLVAHKELRQVGEVEVRTVVEELPGRLEVDAYSEEVVVEHVPVGQFVDERVDPWEEDGTLVVPVYEEQLVVVKRLLLKEEIRVRRVGATERRLIEEPIRRERVVVDDPNHTGLVHERFPLDEPEGPALERHELESQPAGEDADEGGFGGLLKKMLT